jgi:hypothetical protein
MLTIGPVDLDCDDAPGAQEAREAHAEASAALHADAIQGTESLSPCQEFRVAGLRRRHGLASESHAEPVEGDADVHVGVGVNPENDRGLGF